MTSPVEPDKLTYQQAVAELEAIITELDDGSVDLDLLATKFERAVAIVEDLEGRVLKAKAQVDELNPRLENLRKRAATEDE